MASPETYESRTEQPTPLRLDEARRAGKVPRSADVTNVAVILTAVVMLAWLGPMLLCGAKGMTASLLDGRAAPLASPTALVKTTQSALVGVLLPAAGIVGACVVAAIVAGLVQVKPLATFEPIRPQWSRLGLAAGLRRMASLRSGVRTLLAVAKLAVLAYLAVGVVRNGIVKFVAVIDGNAVEATSAMGDAMRSTLVPLLAALVVLAVADWLYQRWQYRHDLRMTRQQWKDDMKRMEGDATIRNARRRDARRKARQDGRDTKGQTA